MKRDRYLSLFSIASVSSIFSDRAVFPRSRKIQTDKKRMNYSGAIRSISEYREGKGKSRTESDRSNRCAALRRIHFTSNGA